MTEEQHGVDFGGLESGAMAFGRGYCSTLPLERPNIPKDEHPTEANREGQVSYGFFSHLVALMTTRRARSLQRLPQKT